ncbi:MAG: AI-2E family transporter [Candidatus Endonucleobacter sp. (ex Gigantidas childressi)]|nr:AI-2E family transporter [Candidatus Endonucleobacter sp. (ex Gigantidas childressi)]
MTVQQRWMLVAVTLAFGVILHFLSEMLAPFVISIVLAYLGDPLADRLERLGLSRVLVVTLVFIIIFLLVIITLLVVAPLIFQQLKALIQLLPLWESWLQANVWPLAQKHLDLDPKLFDLSGIARNLAGEWQKTGGSLAHIGLSVTRSSIALAGFLANVCLVPVVTFYLLRDWDKMMSKLRMIIPRNIEDVTVDLATACDDVLAAFLKGQLVVMLILGVIYSIGLTLVGLKFAVLIGILAGLASIIPYMGFVLGFTAALTVALFQFDTTGPLIAVTAVYIFGQALEGWVLTPHLVGDKIGLHPVAVIFALMAGGHLHGFVGMLIALPLAAIIMVFLGHLHQNYRKSHFYHAKSLDK